MVSADEMQRMMVMMGNRLTDEEVRDIMKECGSAERGAISYPEFCKLMGVGHKQAARAADTNDDDLQHAFALFDLDRDGQISPKEMTQALKMFGVTLTDREVDQLIGEATLSEAKTVSYEVFKRVMMAARDL